MSQPRDVRRVVELRLLPAVITFAVVLAFPLAGELPDRIATHWNASGDPNGSMPRTAFWIGATIVWLGLWVVLERRSAREPARRGARMPEAITILWLGGFVAGTTIAVALANQGADEWTDANVAGFILVVPILGSAALAATGAWLCERGRTYASRPAAARKLPSVALGRGERAMWVGRAKSGPMLGAGVVIGAALAVATQLGGAPSGLLFLAPAITVAISLIWASQVRVAVTAKGVRIAFGPLSIPSRFVALDKIEAAEAIDVEPLQWGGWGYRWAGRGRSAVVVRRGPGILIRKRDGHMLVVTVDHAGQAAGLVNDLIAQAE